MEANGNRMYSFKRILLGVLLISVTITATSADDEHKIIETKNGQIRGLRKTTLLKKVPYDSFKGIPYAKPPIGDLRFKVNKIAHVLWSLRCVVYFNRCFRHQNRLNRGHQQYWMHLNTATPAINLIDS